jgi:hypothetical protein
MKGACIADSFAKIENRLSVIKFSEQQLITGESNAICIENISIRNIQFALSPCERANENINVSDFELSAGGLTAIKSLGYPLVV